MKKIKHSVLVLVVLVITVIVSGYTNETSEILKSQSSFGTENIHNQTINMFVTHGHCSTPFAGDVDVLKINIPTRNDLGNPLENMSISFDVNPNSFNVCAGKDLTAKIKTPGLFINDKDEKITFKSTSIYTMGIDWYQINGKMSIKGLEKDVKLFVTGIRDSKDTMTSSIVLEGQLNLFDWGIDYDMIVNGKSSTVKTKWLYINMKINIS